VNNRIYDIDYSKLVNWLIPTKLRNARQLNFLQVLTYPVTTLYQQFLRYRTAKVYQLTITPQVCYLVKLLNDRYDFALRRITIVDPEDKSPLYVFKTEEAKPVYLGSSFIFTDGEAGAIKDDFIVKVPAAISFEDAEMLSLLKSYRLAAMKTKIQRV
jgi:hypothetical protein